jgi:hypothetical protein
MSLPSNPVAVPAVTYEYLFCLSSSEWLWPPGRWKARGLLLGSCTAGTVGHQLRPKNLDTTDSLQQRTTAEPFTPYQTWPHDSWLKRGDHHTKKKQTWEQSTLTHPLVSVVMGRQDFTTCQPATSLPHGPVCSRAPIGLTQGLLDTG